MIPDKTINDLINKHANLERELSSGDVDKKFFAEKSKEYSDLNEIIEDAKKYLSFEKDKKELEKILADENADLRILEQISWNLKKPYKIEWCKSENFEQILEEKFVNNNDLSEIHAVEDELKISDVIKEIENEEEGGLLTLKRVSFGLYYFVASSIAVALLCDFTYSSKVGGYGSTSFRLRLFYFSKELLFFLLHKIQLNEVLNELFICRKYQ